MQLSKPPTSMTRHVGTMCNIRSVLECSRDCRDQVTQGKMLLAEHVQGWLAFSSSCLQRELQHAPTPEMSETATGTAHSAYCFLDGPRFSSHAGAAPGQVAVPNFTLPPGVPLLPRSVPGPAPLTQALAQVLKPVLSTKWWL
jgi:hypothetical protein